MFGDYTLANAIIDRLVHHSQIIKITGPSYRIKDKRLLDDKVLNPINIDSFIKNLDKKHEIIMEIFYLDGSYTTEKWDAQKITKENLWSNINSKVGHRKDKEKIGKVVFKV